MLTPLSRVWKTGVQHFWRNGWLSAATISVMVLALSMILGLLLLSVITESVVRNLQDKIDVSVYFKSGTPEENIMQVRNNLLGLPEVKDVEYVSEEEALARFKERHKDDTVIAQALSELDTNPLEASINIKAKESDQFPAIVSFLEKEEYKEITSKINYYENKETIERLSRVVSGIRRAGGAVAIALSLIAVLVAFNTIRIAIYTLRDEVGIMRLVGGTNWFVRGPFLVEGFLYGAVSSALTMLLFYPIVFWISPSLSGFFPGASLLDYFVINFFTLWLVLFGAGAFLGVFGSFIAIRKYLRV